MLDLIKKSLDFIKKNPRIIYSLILIFFIPLAIYYNTYFNVSRFEDNLNQVVRKRAVLAEDIAKFTTRNLIDKPEELQSFINEIKEQNEDIQKFEVFLFETENDRFKIVASGEKEKIGMEVSEEKDVFYHRLAWNNPEDNVSFVSMGDDGRYWNVVETIRNNTGEKTALISLSFPLKEFDQMNRQAEIQSYLILTVTIIIVLLLVANNTRLFGYALTLSKLKEIDKMKDDFISMASHELRSPLLAMKGHLDLFKEKNQSLDSESRHYLENVSVSTERLDLLVNDILEVSRIEGNRIPISISPVDPQKIIGATVEEMKPQATRKGLDLIWKPQELPKINVDPERFKQILVNLISNATKYTLQGKVEINTNTKDDFLAITIADTGIGISAENQKSLFEKFKRIHNDKTKNVIGTGLGLWITRELAHKMKGDITVESIEGVGSHFIIHLPLAK